MKDETHAFFEDQNGMIHLAVNSGTDDESEYMMFCPHCAPSYFLYKPKFTTAEVCYNEGKDICNECYEPECEHAKGSYFKENDPLEETAK